MAPDSWELAWPSQRGHDILLLNKNSFLGHLHQTRPLGDMTDEDKNDTIPQPRLSIKKNRNNRDLKNVPETPLLAQKVTEASFLITLHSP